MKPSVLGFARFAVLLLGFVMAAGACSAETWTPWWGQDWQATAIPRWFPWLNPVNPLPTDLNFPARVRDLVFPNGVAFDARRPIQLGAWRVAFGPSTATSYQRIEDPKPWDPNTSAHHLFIDGLLCTNSVLGARSCEIHLTWLWNGGYCALDITGNSSPTPNLICPATIDYY